ncbi:Trp biosynthesis-associated membrane protein, partial [Streptosporangium sandarakinum]
MTAARALWTWVAVCAAGAGLVLLASGRDWFTVTYGARAVPVAAADVAPALGPAAWASLAAVVAVLATRGVWRRIVGGVMAVCGAGAVAAAWAGSRPAAALWSYHFGDSVIGDNVANTLLGHDAKGTAITG